MGRFPPLSQVSNQGIFWKFYIGCFISGVGVELFLCSVKQLLELSNSQTVCSFATLAMGSAKMGFPNLPEIHGIVFMPKPDGWDVRILVSSKIRPFVWQSEDMFFTVLRIVFAGNARSYPN